MKKNELNDENLSKVTGGGPGGPSESLIPQTDSSGEYRDRECPNCHKVYNEKFITTKNCGFTFVCPNPECGIASSSNGWKYR